MNKHSSHIYFKGHAAIIFIALIINPVITCSSKSEGGDSGRGDFIDIDKTKWSSGTPETQVRAAKGNGGRCEVSILPNVGYAFRGYNILFGNPFHADTDGDPGFRLPIFKASHYGRRNAEMKYRLPNGVHGYMKQICKVDTQSKEITNEKSYQDDLIRRVGGGIGGGLLNLILPIAFSANAAYQRTSHKIAKEQHLFVKTENTCNVFELILDKSSPPMFTDGFLQAAKRLEDDEDAHAYADFLKDYGTHYLEKTNLGARYAVETEFSKTAKNTLYRDRFDFKAAAGLNFKISFGLNVETGKNKEIIEQFQELQKSHSILSYGSPIPKDGNGKTWANSVFDNPLPIHYKLGKIQDLFTERFMKSQRISTSRTITTLDFKTIRNGLNRFINGYCEQEKDNLGISKCDGPDGGCGGGHNCHHNAKCVTETKRNGVSYRCECLEGYQGDGRICTGWNADNTILDHNRYNRDEKEQVWGDWHEEERCAENTYAYALALKVHPNQRGGFLGAGKDNSGLNGVKLYCRNPHTKRQQGDVTSGIGGLGSWTRQRGCYREDSFLIGYRFKAVAPRRGQFDRVFGVNIDVKCQDGESIQGLHFQLDKGKWYDSGEWSSETSCPTGEAICGIKTRIFPKVARKKDDAGLTDVKLICCKF